MEQNDHLPLVAKKVRSLVRAILFMIKKNISKRKLLLDLNMMIKRGKITGKAFNHRSHHPPTFTFPSPTDHYEFSCSNTPVYPLSLFTTHKKHHNNHKKMSNNNKPVFNDEQDDPIFVDHALMKALEMLTASPAVNMKSPVVRQLRVTDSPFPLSNGEEDSYVDEAAERFIMKFYSELRKQS